MANPSISWTDAQGPATITSPAPRLGDWAPDAIPVGDEATALGSGLVSNFVYRIDYVVAFEMQELWTPYQTLFQRLKLWLMSGGQVTLFTADLSANSYVCTMWEKKPPTWQLDRVNLIYTLKLYLRNTVQAPLVANYEPGNAIVPGSAIIVVTPDPIALTFP